MTKRKRDEDMSCIPAWNDWCLRELENLIFGHILENTSIMPGTLARGSNSRMVDIVALIRLRLVCRDFNERLNTKWPEGAYFKHSDRSSWYYWMAYHAVPHPSMHSLKEHHWTMPEVGAGSVPCTPSHTRPNLPLICAMVEGAVHGGHVRVLREILNSAFSGSIPFADPHLGWLWKTCTRRPSTALAFLDALSANEQTLDMVCGTTSFFRTAACDYTLRQWVDMQRHAILTRDGIEYGQCSFVKR